MIAVDIIGGGFCGTMVLWHLMQQDDLPPLDISFYDESGRHGRGVAYSTPYAEHLLNVAAGGMGALPEKHGDFLRWLGHGADKAAFYPRRLYGDYLRHMLDEALARGKENGHEIVLVSERKEDPSPGVLTVLATGTSQPFWPGGIKVSGPRLIKNPYQPGIAVPEDTKIVLILGTGLSAVDAVLTLNAQGYQGDIICVSRNGLWPVRHGPKEKFWQWRWYLEVLRPHLNTIWRVFPKALKVFCIKNMTFWNVIRHRMPGQCYKILQGMRDAGRLQTVKGTIQGLECFSGHVEIDLGLRTIRGDLVINCLGFISAKEKAAGGLRISEHVWTLGPPLFGHLIETTAVPELRQQAKRVSLEIIEALQFRT